MIKRPSDLFRTVPEVLEECRRLAQLSAPLVDLEMIDGELTVYKCTPRHTSWLWRSFSKGSDFMQMGCIVEWLREGPKIACMTAEQFDALARIEIDLELKDLPLPYPSVLVNLPPGYQHKAVLVHRFSTEAMGAYLISGDFKDDVETAIRQADGRSVESFITIYESDVMAEEAKDCASELRAALNLLMAMTHFGHVSELVFPAEVERDRRLSGERTDRGEKARRRLAENVSEVKFDREVILHTVAHERKAPGEPTGREMPFHWRRGHWAMIPCGEGRAERKRVLRKPCMVRPDKIVGNPTDYVTSYKS